jgi:hypothetical protein
VRPLPSEDLLQIIGCEIGARPAAAPGLGELAPHLLRAERSPGALTAHFAAEAAETLEAFVAAERQCCPGLGWQLSRGAGEVTLRIAAAEPALEVLAKMFDQAEIEKTQ